MTNDERAIALRKLSGYLEDTLTTLGEYSADGLNDIVTVLEVLDRSLADEMRECIRLNVRATSDDDE